MKNKILIATVAILAASAAVVWYFAIFSKAPKSVEMTQANSQSAPKNDDSFTDLKGDAFDEAYIANMLAHHEGAVNMAEQAAAVTMHEEVRTLASNIMQTQSTEMINMRTWQQAWGYRVTNSGGHMSHSGGGMQMSGDMVEMQNKLQNLTGEEYDREFLKQMIIHHEQAIAMSQPAAVNAKHREVKDLASAVIKAQAVEIQQMKQWQKEWGY